MVKINDFDTYELIETNMDSSKPVLKKQEVTIILCEDYVGNNPIKELLIREGSCKEVPNPRSVSKILMNPEVSLISVTQVGSGATLFYLGWNK